MAVLGLTGEVDGYIYLGQQTPAFYAKQVIASLVKYGKELLPPFFGGLMAYDGEANIDFRVPRASGRPVLSEVSCRPASSSSISARAFFEMTFAMPMWISEISSFTKARRRKLSATRRGFSAPIAPISS